MGVLGYGTPLARSQSTNHVKVLTLIRQIKRNLEIENKSSFAYLRHNTKFINANFALQWQKAVGKYPPKAKLKTKVVYIGFR